MRFLEIPISKVSTTFKTFFTGKCQVRRTKIIADREKPFSISYNSSYVPLNIFYLKGFNPDVSSYTVFTNGRHVGKKWYLIMKMRRCRITNSNFWPIVQI